MFESWSAVDWRRADRPGSTNAHPCLEHLRRTCAPAERPRPKSSRRSAPRAPVQGSTKGRGGPPTSRLEVEGMNDEVHWLVGIDWGSEQHRVGLLDAEGGGVGD